MPSILQQASIRHVGLLAISVLLGSLFTVFFYDTLPGLSFPIFVLCTLGGFLFLAFLFEKKLPTVTLALMAPMVFCSAMVFVRANPFLLVLNVGTTIFLFFLVLRMMKVPLRAFTIAEYFWTISMLPFYCIGSGGRVLPRMLSFSGMREHRSTTHIIRGILLTIPILFVFLVLLASADLVFQQYVLSLFDWDVNPMLLTRAMLVAVVSFLSLGAFSLTFMGEQKSAASGLPSKEFGIIEATVLLGAINVLFFLFLLVQVRYLFAGESAIQQFDFTYAEYARQGFFQLLAVSVLSFLLTLSVERWIARKEGSHYKRFTVFSTLLIAQALILLGSAYMRLSLYEQAYGFTMMRLLSHTFMLWLAVLFLWLLYHVYRRIREGDFLLGVLLSGLLTLSVLNALNPEAYIVGMNLELAAVNGKLDTEYFWSLSEDAVPRMAGALQLPDPVIRDEIRKLLVSWETRIVSSDTDWRSLTLSRMRAKTFLENLDLGSR